LEQDLIKKALHPPSSPDLAPSNFSLFGHVKQFLAGQQGLDEEALGEAVNAILADIEKVPLERAFPEEMESLRECLETGGEDIDETISLPRGGPPSISLHGRSKRRLCEIPISTAVAPSFSV
jgi:hypothetical protein